MPQKNPASSIQQPESMPLNIASIASGSNGNCYYIENDNEAVLIDAGISCREAEHRMNRIGLSLKKVKAIFISHEHTDHTRGVEVISRKYSLPVYITAATLGNSRLWIDPKHAQPFTSAQSVQIGDLRVNAVPKRHDAAEPHSFTIEGNGVTVGVFTDIGVSTDHVIKHLGNCHAAFLEANYDEKMLEEGRYPVFLKRRISGADGHLSNSQALELFTTHCTTYMKLLVLSHLSAHNNSPELVYDLFTKHANGTKVVVASRYMESEVFEIDI